MPLEKMDKNAYSEHWSLESDNLESKGIYERLAEITPTEKTLEIGGGSGISTRHLAQKRQVLSIESNDLLLRKAKSSLEGQGLDVKFLYADVFELSQEHVSNIKAFSPKGIVCWFIGSHADHYIKYTPDTPSIFDKPKKYRENIEDALLSQNLCPESIEWIHLANRGAIVDLERDKAASATADDYNTHVFLPNGFEVVSVEILDWDRNGSDFIYVNGKNPNLASGSQTPSVVSILARRKN
jgi:hypothetical protein